MHRRSPRYLIFVLLGLILLLGLTLLVFFWLPYDLAGGLADLLARDGSLDAFDPELHARLRPLSWLGLALILAAGLGWWRREWLARHSQALASWLNRQARALWQDRRRFFGLPGWSAAARPTLVLVLAFSGLSALQKLVWLDRPLGHDEAYTYIAFASRPLGYLLRDYHLPNNHIFHSLLVHISTGWLGNQPWTLRLPAFLAGVLLVPAAYLAGKAWYGRRAGLLLAGLVAVLPVLGEYSTRGRGYSLLLLSNLLLLYLAARLVQEKNRFGWLLFGLVAVMGFYSIPIFLYPFGVLWCWLLLSGLAGQARPAYAGGFWKYLLASTAGAGLMTIGLYLPVFLYSGLDSVTSNSFVQPLAWDDFWASLMARAGLALAEWATGLPPGLWAFLWLAFLAGLLAHRRSSPLRVSLAPAWLLAMGSVLLWQRVAPENRVWLFSLPYFLLIASGGLVGGTGWLRERLRLPAWSGNAALALALAFIAAWGGWQAWQGRQNLRVDTMGPTEQVMLWLSNQMAPQDILLVNLEEGPAAWYYGRYYGLADEQLFKIQPHDFQTAWVVVHNGRYGEDLGQVLALYPAFEGQLQTHPAGLALDLGGVQVYSVSPTP